MSTMTSVPRHIHAGLGSNIEVRNEHENAGVLIVSADPAVRHALSQALDESWTRIEYASGAASAKQAVSSGGIMACLCGFNLENGTYKEIVKHAKHQAVEVPVIIASTPNCANEYGEYLGAMNAGAFDFLCHPYQCRELNRMLAIALRPSHRLEFSRHF